MATLTREPEVEVRVVPPPKKSRLGWQLLGVLLTWVALWRVFGGQWTLETGVPSTIQDWLQSVVSSLGLVSFTQPIIAVLNALYDGGVWLTEQLGWTGMIGLCSGLALIVAGSVFWACGNRACRPSFLWRSPSSWQS